MKTFYTTFYRSTYCRRTSWILAGKVIISTFIFVIVASVVELSTVHALSLYPDHILTANGVFKLRAWEDGLVFTNPEMPLGVYISDPVINLMTLVRGDYIFHSINDNMTYVFDIFDGELLLSFDFEAFTELRAAWEEYDNFLASYQDINNTLGPPVEEVGR